MTSFDTRDDLINAVCNSSTFPFFSSNWPCRISRPSSTSNLLPRLAMDGYFTVPKNRFGYPFNPEEARRMKQRKRMVDKGKNTIGYSEYTRQVPKERRKPKSMEHPRTPDHQANIPNRRWLGMVSAWRVALHQYDPPDCVSDVTMRTKPTPKTEKSKDVVIVAEEDYLEDVAQLEAGGEDELDKLDTNNEFFLEEDDDDDDDLL